MAAIFGQCPRCPKNAPAKRLYGGVCSYHLGHPTEDQSKEKIKEEVKKDHESLLLKQFFADQVKIMPARCENCGNKIITTAAWPKSSAVCHIIPKRHFKSVMLYPANRWFGCINCHGDYDNKGWSFAVTMPVWPVCCERFREFMTLIKDTELRYLPNPLMEILNSVG